MLDKASLALSGLSKCAALVMAPSVDLSVNHIEFVPVQDRKILDSYSRMDMLRTD